MFHAVREVVVSSVLPLEHVKKGNYSYPYNVISFSTD